jgi:nicotinamide-nucleotide amidase
MYDQQIIAQIKDHMLGNHQTVSVAESVTSGHLQVALSSAENASKFFQGGITTYNLGQKSRHLKVEPIHAEACNCVSEKVAAEMALHVANLFSSDWGIGITGYAAPVPECNIDELFAYYAISHQGKLVDQNLVYAEKAEPIKVQIFYVDKILTAFNELIINAKNGHQSSFSSSDLNSINSKSTSAGPVNTSPSIEKREP